MANNSDSQRKTVLVCGMSGAGKSRFINTATGANLHVGHTIDSETNDIWDRHNGVPLLMIGTTEIELVDTPGFQDTRDENEGSVFRKIADWAAERHHNNEPITGIIYLRSIQEPRVLRAETTLMKMFKELCGADCLDHILVVTNRWQPPPEKEEEDREQQMVTDIRRFGSTGSKRVLVQRLSGKYTQEDAHRVLELFRYIPPVTFRIQQEMVDQGLRYDQTTAGKVIEDALTAKVEELRAELASQKNDNTLVLESLNNALRQIEELRKRPGFWERLRRVFTG